MLESIADQVESVRTWAINLRDERLLASFARHSGLSRDWLQGFIVGRITMPGADKWDQLHKARETFKP